MSSGNGTFRNTCTSAAHESAPSAQIQAGILQVDHAGTVQSANEVARDLLGVEVGGRLGDAGELGRAVAEVARHVSAHEPISRRMRAPTAERAAETLIVHGFELSRISSGAEGIVLFLMPSDDGSFPQQELHVRRIYDEAEPRLHHLALVMGSEHAFLDEAAGVLGETARADQVFILLSNEDADAYEEEARWARHTERSLIPLRVDASSSPLASAVEQGVVHLRPHGDASGVEFDLVESMGAAEALAVPFQTARDGKGILLLTHAAASDEWTPVELEAIGRLATLFETLLSWMRAEERYRKVISAIDDCLAAYSFDAAGERSFSLATPQLERIAAVEAKALMRGEVSWTRALVHPEDVEAVHLFERKLRSGEESSLAYRIVVDGESRWVRESAVPRRAPSGRVEVASILSDVTEQKEVEAALVTAKQSAEAANRAKSIFLATMSHELRTPLGVIKGFTDLLEEEVKALPGATDDIAEFAAVIRENATRVLELVGKLLDLTRLQTDGLAINSTPISIDPLVQAVVARFTAEAKAGGLSTSIQGLPSGLVVSADAGRLEQVLDTILDNAVRFTDEGGVSVVVAPGRQEVSVEVRDTGVGISEAAMERVFEPFFQEDNDSNRQRKGSGLGLALALRLMEAMGGRIELESVVGEGTTVRLLLPIAEG